MKKILYLVCLFISFQSFAQDSTKTSLRPYISIGTSIGNVNPSNPGTDNFSKASYPSIEGGIMGKNVSLGLVLGCENFFVTANARKFYELKTAISYPINSCSVYALFGAGAYFEKKFNNFIEYGAGFSYMPEKLGYFVQYSNWAGSNYVSLGATYAF